MERPQGHAQGLERLLLWVLGMICSLQMSLSGPQSSDLSDGDSVEADHAISSLGILLPWKVL